MDYYTLWTVVKPHPEEPKAIEDALRNLSRKVMEGTAKNILSELAYTYKTVRKTIRVPQAWYI